MLKLEFGFMVCGIVSFVAMTKALTGTFLIMLMKSAIMFCSESLDAIRTLTYLEREFWVAAFESIK